MMGWYGKAIQTIVQDIPHVNDRAIDIFDMQEQVAESIAPLAPGVWRIHSHSLLFCVRLGAQDRGRERERGTTYGAQYIAHVNARRAAGRWRAEQYILTRCSHNCLMFTGLRTLSYCWVTGV